jgi:hypothetical protein
MDSASVVNGLIELRRFPEGWPEALPIAGKQSEKATKANFSKQKHFYRKKSAYGAFFPRPSRARETLSDKNTQICSTLQHEK